MLKKAAKISLAMSALSPAYADGVTPSTTTAAGTCYASGSSGPVVPCIQRDQTSWDQVLRPTDPADGLTVTPSTSPARATTLREVASGQVVLSGSLTDADVQAAINSVPSGSAVLIRFSATARVTLNANPTTSGRAVSWDIDPQTMFSGTGRLPGPTSTSLHSPDNRLIAIQRVKGEADVPTTDLNPVAFYDKQSGNTAIGLNSTVAIGGVKRGGGDGTAISSLTVNALDAYGWPNRGTGGNPYVEAIRANAECAPNLQLCSTYGIVAGAGAGSENTTHRFAFGAEMTVFNNNTDAPPTTAFAPTKSITASFHATNDGKNKIDAFYLTNPYIAGSTHAPARAGVLIASGSISDVAFATQASSLRGLDLSMGSFSEAAIGLPNSAAVMARNAAGSGWITLLSSDSSDNVAIGNGSRPITLNSNSISLPNGAAIRARDAAGTGWLSMLYTDPGNSVTVGDGAHTVILNGGVYAAAGAVYNGTVSAPVLRADSQMVLPFGTPSSANSTCAPGQIQVDATYIYTCIDVNSWHRASNGTSW